MKHIVCISGGKDSTAMALRLREIYYNRNFVFICTPTGDELPDMQDHWSRLETLLDSPILRLVDPKHPTIYDLINHFQMLPNFRARWCTRILKIETAQAFYNENKPAVVYVGLRADESKRQGNKLFDADIDQQFPMQEWKWGISHVWSYLNKKGVSIPRRTDCAMCFYQRIGEWWNLWKFYPDRWNRIEMIEKKIGHTLLSPGKWTNWPSPLKDLRKEFEKGRTPRGAANQIPLFRGIDDGKCRACTL